MVAAVEVVHVDDDAGANGFDAATGGENDSNRRRPCASRVVSRDEIDFHRGFRQRDDGGKRCSDHGFWRDGGIEIGKCNHGVVVAAGCARKKEQSRTPIVAAGAVFSGDGTTGWLRPASCSGGRTWTWRPWKVTAAEMGWC